jgi:uncharacterized protein YjcR
MTNSELLNALVTKMAEQKGYAYTTGYLQSFLMQVISETSKKTQSTIHSDLVWHLNQLDNNCKTDV